MGNRMPPGKNMDDWWTILRSGMWRLYYKLSTEGKKRYFSEFLPLLHDTKHEVMGERDDDSYYLVYLGSKPNARGKGYARKLIEHMTAIVRLPPFHPSLLSNPIQ
jgi:ribosomal protein S18 acetylase RimI-like enzyme